MTMKKLSIFLLLGFFGCQSPSDQIAKAFETVNTSLERSNRVLLLEDSCQLYHLSILKKAEKNESEARKADSIYQSVQNFNSLITRAEALLKEKDPTGKQTSIASSLLVRTALGDSIRAAVADLSACCRAALRDAGKRGELNQLLEQPEKVTDSSQWNGNQFAGEPTVAAQTTLSFFRLQCTKAATLTLREIDTHL